MYARPPYPLIIAHRGASAIAPENMVAAFKKAIESGAEGIEFDVRLSKDRVPIVFHDSQLSRIAGDERRVSDLTSNELILIDAGSWFNRLHPDAANPRFSAERIPTLKQTLKLLRDYRGVIYIELKCRIKEISSLTEAVCREIAGSPLLSRIIIKSFKLDVIPQIKEICPKVKTAALFAPKIKTIVRREKPLISIAKQLGADFISLHFSLATGKLMESAHHENLPVAVWTTDSPRWIKRSVKLGICHLITNSPTTLLAKRSQLLQNE